MPTRRRFVCFLVVATAAAAVRPLPAQLTVASQNTLHYGWGATRPNEAVANKKWDQWAGTYKTQELLKTLTSGMAKGKATAGVLMMQEVMPSAALSPFTDLCPPGPCIPYASDFYGRGWYRESYVFLVRDPAKVSPVGPFACPEPGCSVFSRPPAFLRVTTPAGLPLHLVDFHAIWGKNQGQRLREASAMATVVANLPGGPAILVGGDWNLPVPKIQEELAGAVLAPDVLTSLNPNGLPSSSYDHFWFVGLAPNAASIYPPKPSSWPAWRDFVSDHLGIFLTVP